MQIGRRLGRVLLSLTLCTISAYGACTNHGKVVIQNPRVCSGEILKSLRKFVVVYVAEGEHAELDLSEMILDGHLEVRVSGMPVALRIQSTRDDLVIATRDNSAHQTGVRYSEGTAFYKYELRGQTYSFPLVLDTITDISLSFDRSGCDVRMYNELHLRERQFLPDIYLQEIGDSAILRQQIAHWDSVELGIADGADRVRRMFGVRGRQVAAIVQSGHENAFAILEEPGLSVFFSTYMSGLDREKAQCVSEHEALHHVVFARRYTVSLRMRKLYARIKGYGPDDEAYHEIIRSGGTSHEMSEGDYFLRFINEKNYFRGVGGHAQDDVHEFVTTFVHAMMRPELLAERIAQTVVVAKSGAAIGILPVSIDAQRETLYYMEETLVSLVGVARRKQKTHRFLGIFPTADSQLYAGDIYIFQRALREVRRLRSLYT